jgi:hypothetical protein
LKAGYKSKKQSSTHLWLHVTSLALSFSQYYVTFMFQFFKFYLFALPSLHPVSSEHSLSVSLLDILLATSFPTLILIPTRVKEHHLDLEVCIFVASLNVQLFYVFIFVFNSCLHNCPERPQYQGNQAGYYACFQDDAYCPIRVLKLPKADNHLPNRSLEVHLPQVWMGTWESFFILSVIFHNLFYH